MSRQLNQADMAHRALRAVRDHTDAEQAAIDTRITLENITEME